MELPSESKTVSHDDRSFTFSLNIQSIKAPAKEQFSYKTSLREMLWMVSVVLNEEEDNHALSLKICGCPGNKSSYWSCYAKGNIEILYGDIDQPCFTKSFAISVSNRSKTTTLPRFWCMKKLDIDSNGDFIHTTDGIIKVSLTCDYPLGVYWDSKAKTDHVGLKNLGMTCYMNSLLQSFFLLKALRQVIFLAMVENNLCENETNILRALKSIFYELATCKTEVNTQILCKALEWTQNNYYEQEDAHEFCRRLVDKIEISLKGTKFESSVQNFFGGKLKSYIKCLNVDYESVKVEDFQDVQLDVKGMKNVYESFGAYIQPEFLTDDNKYYSDDHGYQDAKKGLIFKSFPPILILQLKRFNFDFETEKFEKLTSRFEFPSHLKLDSFLSDEDVKVSDPSDYFLFGIIVQHGNLNAGHYVAFANVDGKGDWKKFDDEKVMNVTSEEAIENNYGGAEGTVYRVGDTAYMLIYIRESMRNDILDDIKQDSLPNEVICQLEQQTYQNDITKNYNNNGVEVRLYTESDIRRLNCFEIFPKVASPGGIMHFERLIKFFDFKNVIAKTQGLKVSDIRLWELKSVSTFHIEEELPFFVQGHTFDTLLQEDDRSLSKSFYIDVIKEDCCYGRRILGEYNPEYNSLVVLKYFETESIIFIGFLIVDVRKSWDEYEQDIELLLNNVCITSKEVFQSLNMVLYDLNDLTLIDKQSVINDALLTNFTCKVILTPTKEFEYLKNSLCGVFAKFMDYNDSNNYERSFIDWFNPKICLFDMVQRVSLYIDHNPSYIRLMGVKGEEKVCLDNLTVREFRKYIQKNGLNNSSDPIIIFYHAELTFDFPENVELVFSVYYYENALYESYLTPIYFLLIFESKSTIKDLMTEVSRRLEFLKKELPEKSVIWSWNKDEEHSNINNNINLKDLWDNYQNNIIIEPSSKFNSLESANEQFFSVFMKYSNESSDIFNPFYIKLRFGVKLGKVQKIINNYIMDFGIKTAYNLTYSYKGDKRCLLKEAEKGYEIPEHLFSCNKLRPICNTSDLVFTLIFQNLL